MMFVNDIVTSINTELDGIFTIGELKYSLSFFSDYQVLFSTSPTTLQTILNDIETYSNVCGLKINVAKSKVLIFEKKKQKKKNNKNKKKKKKKNKQKKKKKQTSNCMTFIYAQKT